MNSQHNTIIKQKLLKCLRCDDKDCNKSISKTSKAINLIDKKKHAMSINNSDTINIQEWTVLDIWMYCT